MIGQAAVAVLDCFFKGKKYTTSSILESTIICNAT